MPTVSVELGDRSYPIHIGHGVLNRPESLGDMLDGVIRGRQVALVTNPTVNGLYGQGLSRALCGAGSHRQVDTFEMPDGERFKTLDTYSQAMDFLMSRRHNRTTCIVALGGGVVGDVAGFVAATFQRGVDYVQIPTTLLAQVDSSVGGKTAVNHPSGKNMIGAFYQPRCVVIDTGVLKSLPQREYAAGLAEVVKYGVIADVELFAWIESHTRELLAQQPEALRHVVRRSCEIKADVVARDETEGGVRAILNFGHTFGHAIENLAGYGAWLHGEAVAMGMVMAARFSERLGLLSQGQSQRIAHLLKELKLPVNPPEGLAARAMLEAMGMDKKTVDGRVRFVITGAIGQAEVTSDYTDEALQATLAEFCRS